MCFSTEKRRKKIEVNSRAAVSNVVIFFFSLAPLLRNSRREGKWEVLEYCCSCCVYASLRQHENVSRGTSKKKAKQEEEEAKKFSSFRSAILTPLRKISAFSHLGANSISVLMHFPGRLMIYAFRKSIFARRALLLLWVICWHFSRGNFLLFDCRRGRKKGSRQSCRSPRESTSPRPVLFAFDKCCNFLGKWKW